MKQSAKFRLAPRFSTRLLLALAALFAAYFATGPATKRQGMRDIQAIFPPGPFGESGNVAYVAPMLLSSTVSSYEYCNDTFTLTTKYYFWFFGKITSLPVQSQESHEGDDYLLSLALAMKENQSSED